MSEETRLEIGTLVKTVLDENNITKDWVPEALASRRWDIRGVVEKHSDSHGFCYGVRHEDGSGGWYDPHELEEVQDNARSDSSV